MFSIYCRILMCVRYRDSSSFYSKQVCNKMAMYNEEARRRLGLARMRKGLHMMRRGPTTATTCNHLQLLITASPPCTTSQL